MNLTEALVLVSLPSVAVVLSVLFISVACFLRWRKSRTKSGLAMMLGSVFTVVGPLLITVSLLTAESEEIEPGLISVQTHWWDSYLPIIAPLGFLVFGAAFLLESIKLKKSNQPPQTTATSGRF